jgi:FkbM family methyltransferase
MKQHLRKLRRSLYEFVGKEPKIRRQIDLKIERHGSDYGGWCILLNSLTKSSVVYSFGIGEDISFDESIINKYNCKVYAYDPTPRVKDWLSARSNPLEFLFHPYALSDSKKNLRFYPPSNEKFISHSILPTGSDKYIDVEAKDIATILQENGHTEIDLLKMDIEGSEYEVINDIVRGGYKIKQLLIEFHHFNGIIKPSDTINAIKSLNEQNYKIFSVSETGHEVSFIRTL